MDIGTQLSALRRKRGQSLQDVAETVGVSRAHIWELEKGRTANPSMSLVVRLADHLGLSVGFVIGEDLEADDGDAEMKGMFGKTRNLETRERVILSGIMRSLLESSL